MDSRVLEVISEDDQVLGLEERTKIHQEGLLHRETHVWFYTPQGEVIFQHRSKDKDTYPDLLDATVGGHVEPNDTYLQTAIKEAKEETGILVPEHELHFLKKIKMRSFDEVTKKINYAFKTQYAYCYKGSINDLQIENGKGAGFEEWLIDSILKLSDAEKRKFVPVIFEPEFIEVFEAIKKLL